MSFQIDQVLEVLKDHNINPPSDPKTLPIPEIGTLGETEEIYPVNLRDIDQDFEDDLEVQEVLITLREIITSQNLLNWKLWR